MVRPRRAHWRRRGFTLLEMLVTLAIVAMVSALLWQGMHQVLRVERLLQRSGVEGQLQVVRREWLRGLIQASLVEQRGKALQFTGEAQRLTVASAEALDMRGLGAGRLELLIDTDPRTGLQRLLMSSLKDPGDPFAPAPAAPVELLSWSGKPGRLQFLDTAGRWHDRWPPAALPQLDPLAPPGPESLQLLPRAVWLDLGADAGGSLIIELSVTEPARMNRLQWERQ